MLYKEKTINNTYIKNIIYNQNFHNYLTKPDKTFSRKFSQ